MDVVIPKTWCLLGPISLNSTFSVNGGDDFGLLKAVFVPFLPMRGGVAVTLSQRTEHAQHPGRSPEASLPLGSGFATWTHSPAQAAPWSGAMNADGQFLSKVGMIGGAEEETGEASAMKPDAPNGYE